MARRRAKVKYSKKNKFDPSEMTTLLDAPERPRVVKEKVPKPKKKRLDHPDYYGRGICELLSYSGRLRSDWREVFEQLSPNRQAGTRAHVAYLKIAHRVRQELSGRDRCTPEYEIEYLERYHQYEEAWKIEWGHIPGYWNWDLPRKREP